MGSGLNILLLMPVILVCAKSLWAKLRRSTSGIRFPPGPPGVPLLGNIYDIPPIDSHLAYFKLAKRYGPIMHFNLLTQSVVVLSDVKIANDLLEKRGAIYSDRPPQHMASAAGWEWNIATMPHGEAWRLRRRIVHQRFYGNATVQMHGMIRRTSLEFALNLVRTPHNFRHHIRRSAAANIMESVYGMKVASENDPYVEIAEKAMEAASDLFLPGNTVAEALPFLLRVPEWVPFLGQWTKRARLLRKYPTDMIEVPYARAMEDIANGVAQPSMVTDNIELAQQDPANEKALKDACAVAYIGGADTTVSTLIAFVMSMVLWPEYQKKAQQELDRVVGDRLPDFSDQASLPYVEAIIRETYRMFPVTPLALPHAAEEDDIYEGMLIKKGTVVLANVWAMMHNEQTYPDPYTFNPERWMKGRELDKTAQDPRVAGFFGFGRLCPGRHFADASVYLTIATALKCFDFACHVEKGVEIPPSGEIHTGIVSCPVPFECSITPRSESVLRLLDAAGENWEE